MTAPTEPPDVAQTLAAQALRRAVDRARAERTPALMDEAEARLDELLAVMPPDPPRPHR